MTDRLEDAGIILRTPLEAPKTSIIATIGPTSFDMSRGVNRVGEMVKNWMNIARINLSHVDSSDPAQRENIESLIEEVHRIEKETRIPIGILMDISGPKIRVGKVRPDEGKEGIDLKIGETFVLTLDRNHGLDSGLGTREACSIKYTGNLCQDIENKMKLTGAPQEITIDDGNINLVVEKVQYPDIYTRVKYGGLVTGNKGINIPGCKLSIPFITKKDILDFNWLVREKNGKRLMDRVDYLALSFVKDRSNIDIWVGGHLHPHDIEKKIISKIETIEAVGDNFDEILDASDGIMIARGDLGAETRFEEVPKIQRKLVGKTKERGKPVIVATQMLETMKRNKRPTRAEVSDVSNAVLEGVDTLMLSVETSNGIDPPNAVDAMARISRRAEEDASCITPEEEREVPDEIAKAISHPIVEISEKLDAKAILAYTSTGETPKYIANWRPRQPVIAITDSYGVVMDLLLFRGVYPALVDYEPKTSREKIKMAVKVIEGMVEDAKDQDLFVLSMGIHPSGAVDREKTNTIHVMRYYK